MAEGHLRRHAAGGGLEELAHRLAVGTGDVPAVDGIAQRRLMHGIGIAIDEPTAFQLAENTHDAAGAVNVFHVHVLLGGRDLGKAGNLAGKTVDVFHAEIDAALMRRRQNMQHRVGGTAHGDIQRHGVFKRRLVGDGARQDGFVLLLIITARQIDDQVTGLDEQPLAVGMGGKRRTVAGQRQTQRLGQTVHGIGREHAGTGTAGRAGRTLDNLHILVGNLVVCSRDHGVDQIERHRLAMQDDLAGLHRTAGNEDGGDVEAHRRIQHAGGDLVAVGNAHHRIGAMGIDHIFHRIRDDLARRQRIEHAVMAHGDTVIDRNRVEFLGDTAGRLDFAGNELAEILQMHMARHELRERIDHRDDRLAEIAVLHAGGAPKAARARHVAAVGCRSGAIGWHGVFLDLWRRAHFRKRGKTAPALFCGFSSANRKPCHCHLGAKQYGSVRYAFSSSCYPAAPSSQMRDFRRPTVVFPQSAETYLCSGRIGYHNRFIADVPGFCGGSNARLSSAPHLSQ